jgi:hypothetical protein
LYTSFASRINEYNVLVEYFTVEVWGDDAKVALSKVGGTNF